MSRGYQKLEVEEEAVKALMDNAKSKDEFRRYQSLYLRVAEKMPTTFISKITGLSQSHIQSIHSSTRTKGLASLASKPKGGRRRSHLSIGEEIALLSEIEKKAIKGGVVEISKVHKLFEEKVGAKVAKNTAYRQDKELKVFFQDEARFGRIDNLRRCWSPKGIRPLLKKQIMREYTYAYGAVSPFDGTSCFLVLPKLNKNGMMVMLGEMAERYPDNYLLVVCDGASAHKIR